jgi:hypothetical protein
MGVYTISYTYISGHAKWVKLTPVMYLIAYVKETLSEGTDNVVEMVRVKKDLLSNA